MNKHSYAGPSLQFTEHGHPNQIQSKACKRCGEVYPVTREFFGQFKSKSKAGVRIGYRGVCRKCMADHTRKYDAENPKAAARRRARRTKRSKSFKAGVSNYIDHLRQELRDQCRFCSKDLNGAGHVDHLTPVARGGTNALGNLTLCCESCNLAKASKTKEEFFLWRKERGLRVRKLAISTESPDPVLRKAIRARYS